MPRKALEQAKENLEADYIRRYLCKKYHMPPTDPRLRAYTLSMALMEYLEDAIEDDRIPIGSMGKPLRKVMRNGVEIYETGDPYFDELEREWADMDVSELPSHTAEDARLEEEFKYDEDTNFLDILEQKVEKARRNGRRGT